MSVLLHLEVAVIFQTLCPAMDWEEAIYQHLLRQKHIWREHGREWYRRLKAEGLCGRGCGWPRAAGKVCCYVCLGEMSKARRDRYWSTSESTGRRAARCGDCGAAGHNRRTCPARVEHS